MTESTPAPSRLRRPLRITGGVVGMLLLALGGLRTLVWFGEQVPMIEPLGDERIEGSLAVRDIRFAQTDFWFYPNRVDAVEGKLFVPAIHADPEGSQIRIRFVRFAAEMTPAADGHSAPVVYLAGGPGGSGVSSATGDRWPFFMKLREVGDVIALDQRGTWSSEPFPVCPDPLIYPTDSILSSEDAAAIIKPVLRGCWEHWAKTLDPSAFNTMESAADLEHLRIALGAEQLNLVGISYGTHLALAYIRQYPDRVNRAVLAGVEGPDHTYKRPRIVDGIVRDIARTLEAETGWSGLVEDIETAIARLAAESPIVTIEDPRTGDDVSVAIGPLDLKTAVFYGLGEREDFEVVARRVRRIANGDNQLLAKFVLQLRSGGKFSAMPLSMDCASGISPGRMEIIRDEEASTLIGDVINLSLTEICPHWPVRDLGNDYRSLIVSDTPVLAVSGTLDPRTPPSNAEEALAGFTQMHHLRIIGGAHGDDLLIATPEIVEAMVRFLKAGDPERTEIVLPPL